MSQKLELELDSITKQAECLTPLPREIARLASRHPLLNLKVQKGS